MTRSLLRYQTSAFGPSGKNLCGHESVIDFIVIVVHFYYSGSDDHFKPK